MKHLVPAAAIAVGLGIATLAAPSAQAYTLNQNLSCSTKDISSGNLFATACSGAYKLGGGENDVTHGGANNIATKLLNNEKVFGDSGSWTFGNKYDGGMASNNSNGLSVSSLGSTSGSFSLSNLDLSKYDLAISLKSAKGFSMYYVKAGTFENASQINWNTQGTSVNKKGKAQGLSHISYYTRMVDTTPVTSRLRRVPEPAAISALLGVGSVALLRRKRKRLAQ